MLSEIARTLGQELAATPVLPFSRFMEIALYTPGAGYYERTGQTIGRRGDFYTSVSVGPLFGELLAYQFSRWAEDLTGSGWRVVEAGAHDGVLARDLLRWLRRNRPRASQPMEYVVVEPSPRRRAWQEVTLEEFAGQVRWVEGWASMPQSGICGVIFSNELLDAMPVRRLGWDPARRCWFEWGVSKEGTGLRWARIGLAAAEARALLRRARLEGALALEPVLPDGFTLDLCPEAVRWWGEAADALGEGKLLTCDYGLTADEFLVPERWGGTLRAYSGHRQAADVLARPGEQDLTAHVNFTALDEEGVERGLRTEGLFFQETFLHRVIQEAEGTVGLAERWSPARKRQWQTLTHPAHLGRVFRVLVQSRPARS